MALGMEDQPPAVTAEEIFQAAAALRRPALLDASEICPAAAGLAATAAQQATVAAFDSLASSTVHMSVVCIRARPMGKRTDRLDLDRLRVVLPLGRDMGVLDVQPLRRTHADLDSLPPLPASVVEAARPGASATDLALTAKLVIE